MNEIFVVTTDSGRLVLRGHRRADQQAVEFEHAVMEAARTGGLPAPGALRTPAGHRVVGAHGRWWSLLTWIDGEQPDRGRHTLEESASMGEMLARVHTVLKSTQPLTTEPPPVEPTADTTRRADELLAFIERLADPGEDEASAARWLTAQGDWLRSHVDEEPPEPGRPSQMIHGDYHDANVVFRLHAVAGVLDWDKADTGLPLEELVRAMHLSFRLEPQKCHAFVDGYRSRRAASADDLDAAARRYGFHRDRSLWLFDELFRRGNERLRPLLNRGPFVPFEVSWDALRAGL